MAKCSTKGCKKGATKRLEIIQPNGDKKNRPICSDCADLSVRGLSTPYRVIDANSKHH